MRQTIDQRFLAKVSQFGRESDGSTAIEYAMVGSLMAVALIAAMSSLGQSVAATYGKVGSALEGTPDMPGPTTAAASMAAPKSAASTAPTKP